jgi:hypothetical protein
MNTFTDQVEQAIIEFARQYPRDPEASPTESAWSFGYTKDTTKRLLSVSKLFLAGPGVSYGFTVYATPEPLAFRVKTFELRSGGTPGKPVTLGDTMEQVALLPDVIKVIRNAENKARELANAVKLECKNGGR